VNMSLHRECVGWLDMECILWLDGKTKKIQREGKETEKNMVRPMQYVP